MNVTRVLGFAAVGALLMLAAPTERAQALSLINPGAAAAVQDDSSRNASRVRDTARSSPHGAFRAREQLRHQRTERLEHRRARRRETPG